MIQEGLYSLFAFAAGWHGQTQTSSELKKGEDVSLSSLLAELADKKDDQTSQEDREPTTNVPDSTDLDSRESPDVKEEREQIGGADKVEKAETKEGLPAGKRKNSKSRDEAKTVEKDSKSKKTPGSLPDEGIEQILIEFPQDLTSFPPRIEHVAHPYDEVVPNPTATEGIEQVVPDDIASRLDEVVSVASEAEDLPPIKSSLLKSFKKKTKRLSRPGFLFRKRSARKSMGKKKGHQDESQGEDNTKSAAARKQQGKDKKQEEEKEEGSLQPFVPVVMTPSFESEPPSVSEVSMSVRLIPTQFDIQSQLSSIAPSTTGYGESQETATSLCGSESTEVTSPSTKFPNAHTTGFRSQFAPSNLSGNGSTYSESTATGYTNTTSGVRSILQSIEQATFVLIDGTATAVVKDVSNRVATAKAPDVSEMMTRATSVAKSQMGEASVVMTRASSAAKSQVEGFVRDAEELVREPSLQWIPMAGARTLSSKQDPSLQAGGTRASSLKEESPLWVGGSTSSKQESPLASDNQNTLAGEKSEKGAFIAMAANQSDARRSAGSANPGSSRATGSISSTHYTHTSETGPNLSSTNYTNTSETGQNLSSTNYTNTSDSGPNLTTQTASISRDENGVNSPEHSVESLDSAKHLPALEGVGASEFGKVGSPEKSSLKDFPSTPSNQPNIPSFETNDTITSSQAFDLLKELYYEKANAETTTLPLEKAIDLIHPPSGVHVKTVKSPSLEDSLTKSNHTFETMTSAASDPSTRGGKIGSETSNASRKSKQGTRSVGSEVKRIGSETSSKVSGMSNNGKRSVEMQRIRSETSKTSRTSRGTTASARSTHTASQRKQKIGTQMKMLMRFGSRTDVSTKSGNSGRYEEEENIVRDDGSHMNSSIRGTSATKLKVSKSESQELSSQVAMLRSNDSEWEKCMAWARKQDTNGKEAGERVHSPPSSTESVSSDGPIEMAFSLKKIEEEQIDRQEVRNEGNVRVFF